MNADLGEDLRRVWRLVGFDLDFVAANLLTLLAQDVDDIECRASREGYGDEFDGLRPGIAGCIVNQEVMSGTAGSYELAMIAKGLSQGYACRYHGFLRVRQVLQNSGRPITSGSHG